MQQDNICPLQPFLLGKARVPFRQWLMTGASSHVEVDVTSSGLSGRGEMEEGRGHKSEKRTLGKLAVGLTFSSLFSSYCKHIHCTLYMYYVYTYMYVMCSLGPRPSPLRARFDLRGR